MKVKQMLSEKQARTVGEQLVSMFKLTKNDAGKYNTTWGHKTLEGLGRCAQRMVEEAVINDEIKE